MRLLLRALKQQKEMKDYDWKGNSQIKIAKMHTKINKHNMRFIKGAAAIYCKTSAGMLSLTVPSTLVINE